MQYSDMEFLYAIMIMFMIVLAFAITMYALLVADSTYQHMQRGTGFVESLFRAFEEYP